MKLFLESPDFLQTIVAEAEKNNDGARAVAENLTQVQLNWKPAPKQWSIAQCLEHLAITARTDDVHFSRVLERAKKLRTIKVLAYKPSLAGGWLAKQINPAGGRNFPAPKAFRPPESSAIADPLGMFLEQQTRFIEFVRQCNGVDYNKARLRSPVTPLMRYSLADAFMMTVLHAKRHLGQARRVREMPEFPRT